ncbi:hypothetical protein [Methanocorpusculum vombati]|uniref:Uncharacterized protein n=1 Tax=Methanocorpusculum vombati TaxID=3002864 RepID=A0ABT4IK52_9EURY|nr:hypothetical protein [Methanocorpusculum vombati]MCZ9318661.1 hypothetical protein [Methanocorpusculum sp.]MCZ0862115.1 hypothetical protein [Methanocorpusculum vombati]MDE2520511.1 hypothetical protein [Methanocorpusculum sp.]MDE2534033.1 hypothetical protein [Methanocorpusculum sp.]MDE2546025.1 hypothetical protein [Methanocorpusculum sp.]
MKTLPLNRKPNGKATVLCQDKEVSVHSSCVFCAHCAGIRVNRRVTPNPYAQAFRGSKGGLPLDQQLMEGMMLFNTVIEDANATDIECSDDAGCGFVTLTRRR